jgi:hypothetical protein
MPNLTIFGQHNAENEMSSRPPRRPDRRRSSSSKHWCGLEDSDHEAKAIREDHVQDDNENNHSNTSYCSTGDRNSNSADDATSDGSSMLVMTEDRIRAFLHDYHMDYDALRGEQTLATWSCFAEQYYHPSFQYVRPSGNPIGVDALVKCLSSDTRIRSVQLVSIDSITILSPSASALNHSKNQSSSNANAGGGVAVVIYTCDHSFEFKGMSSEDRGVMTCVLGLGDKGSGEIIKIVHEHRSSGRPIPKDTRWQSESYVPKKER